MSGVSQISPLTIAILASVVAVLGTLLGVVIGHLLSARSQHKQFVRDSKKDEYRELLDVLGACVRQINELKNHIYAASMFARDARVVMNEISQRQAETAQVNQQVHSTLLAASQALDGKLFIGGALTKHDVKGDWRRLEEMAHLPSAEQQSAGREAFSTATFTNAWIELAKKIGRIAAEDL